MRRDMDVVREIVRQVQSKGNLAPDRIAIEGQETWIVERHLELLMEAGLLEGMISRPQDRDYPVVSVKDLTWAGHDFAGTVLNDTVWGQMKQRISAADMATVPLKIISGIGQKLLEAYLIQQAGLGGT
jgi:hypothetical protein